MPAVTPKFRSVFAPVTALAFASHQFEECKAFLTRRSENTDTVPISDVEQLLLSGDGRFAENGYRLNYLGFNALANALGSGLATLFLDLSAEQGHRYQADLRPDLHSAVSVFNAVVRARIDNVRERMLLVDHRERVVEGFLGLNHRMLDNAVFLEIVDAEMKARQPKALFYRAELVGRELRVFYVDPATQRQGIHADSRHAVMGGWTFNNREDSGKSITAALCLFTKFGVAIEKLRGKSRLTHVGADLVGRAAILAGQAAARELDMDAVLSQIGKLQSTPMGFVEDPHGFQECVDKWAVFLLRSGVRRECAKVIARNAALVGADIDARDQVDVYNRGVLGSRTVYDLLCALLRFAKNEPVGDRERLQGVAMDLLVAPQKKRRKV